jgi:hypothetical protein
LSEFPDGAGIGIGSKPNSVRGSSIRHAATPHSWRSDNPTARFLAVRPFNGDRCGMGYAKFTCFVKW